MTTESEPTASTAPADDETAHTLITAPRGFVVISTERIERIWLVVLVLAVGYTFYKIVDVFLVPIIVAAVFASLAYPMHREWLRVTRNRASIAALLSTLTIILLAIIPIYLVAALITTEAQALFAGTETGIVRAIEQATRWLESVARGGDGSPLGRLPMFGWLKDVPVDRVDWGAQLQTLLRNVGSTAAAVINRTGTGALQLLFNLVIALFTMFYLFRDGDRIVQRVMYLSPLNKRYEQMFVDRLISVARATLRGSLIVGLVQGTLGALTLLAVGAKAPLLWGVVMMFTAMIPMLGTWIVLYPNAIVLFSQGHVVGGTVIVLMTMLVITNVDNVIRPRLVGKQARMHDLLVFFSTLGGIATYGIFGFIVGPIIAALLMALLEIYALEFKHQLDFSHGDGNEDGPMDTGGGQDGVAPNAPVLREPPPTSATPPSP